MRPYCFLLLLVVCGCGVSDLPPAALLPPIPPTGWTVTPNPRHGWQRGNWQIADYNSDGVIDYIRIQDPPGSYNHRTWVDTDYDGNFDSYSDAAGTGAVRIRLRVPAFDPPEATDSAAEKK